MRHIPGRSWPTTPAPPSGRSGGESLRRSATRFSVELVLVVLAALLLGGSTSFGQTVLPDVLTPLANSASGWTLLTALAVWACRDRAVPSAALGAACFVALVLGYRIVSTLRGFSTTETLFLVVGIVVGPFVGVAAAWLHRDDHRAAIGCGVLAGIAVGEGIYGLVVISGTTGWVYWTAIGIAGVALLGTVLLRRLRARRDRALAILLVAAVATAFFVCYTALGELTS